MSENGRIIKCSLRYSLEEPGGPAVTDEEATVELTAETLSLLPRWGQALLFSLREIGQVSAADYRLEMDLASGERLVLTHLGRQYDDFVRELARARNQLMIRDLLMEERLVRGGFRAEYTRTLQDGRTHSGRCEIRLYETALVVIPEAEAIERVPYSYVTSARDRDYTLSVEIEEDGTFTFSQLGRKFDLLVRSLSGAMNDLTINAQETIRDLIPGIDGLSARRAARLLKDGRASRRSDLEAACPGLWGRLEAELEDQGLGEKYAFLKTLTDPDSMSIGIKRGLMGDLTGDYIWFLVPIYDRDPARPGNAVVMEAVSGEATGRATYCFRLTPRWEYPQLAEDPGLLQSRADDFIRRLNRCMLNISFRREPIYLPEERLAQPRYSRYRVAAQILPELRLLRRHFVGRVIYSSLQQWQQNLMELLKFNVSVEDDSLRWHGRDEPGDPEPSEAG